MESIEKEYERLRKRSNLSRSISDVDKCIQLLQNARAAIANGAPPPPSLPLPLSLPLLSLPLLHNTSLWWRWCIITDWLRSQDPTSSAVNLAKLQQTVPATLDKINDSQKEIYSGLNRYGRSLDKVLSLLSLLLSSYTPLVPPANQPSRPSKPPPPTPPPTTMPSPPNPTSSSAP